MLQFGSEPLEAAPDDEQLWLAAVSRALRALQRREAFPIRHCRIAVPGHLALTKFVRTPAVARDKRSRIVQFEAAQNIPHPLEEVVWGHAEVSDDGVDLELMLAAVKLDSMEGLCAAIEAAGFTVVGAEPASVSLHRTCTHATQQATVAVLIADVGARSTHLVFTGGPGFFTRTLPLGGNHVTQALAEDLQIDLVSAETLKLEALSHPSGASVDDTKRKAVSRASDGFIGRLQLEITRSRLGYSRQPGAMMPGRVWLTGAGALLPALDEKLAQGLGLPVGRLDPMRQIDLTERSRLDGAESAAGHLPVLAGLAWAALSPNPHDLELLPVSRRTLQLQRRAEPWWLAAAALMLAATLPPLLYFHARASGLRAQAAAYDRQLAPLRRLEAGNRANLDRLHELERQVEAIKGVAQGRTSWVAFLADLQHRLEQVGDVWLESMQVIPLPASGQAQSTDRTVRRVSLAGRLLDTTNPLAKASDESYDKAKRLIANLGESPFVHAVTDEGFDNSQPGMLRFEVTLVLDPNKPL